MNTIQEARRYLDEARDILREKANKEDGYYLNTKYVKMAGHTAYAGVLVALDGFLGKKGKGRKDVDWYKQQLAPFDKKLRNAFVGAYYTLNLSMSYDGNPSVSIAEAGLAEAENVINWVESWMAEELKIS
ncbi:DUF5618 family protein [Larkinella punicea]|uniref:DUF5618 domain-containing protein n=1 Tax=Larkinella punicea TaxID=2315727 RepID=A0A368JK73_9BACT|nr:DUF5618 family protein [Larkinella punicea]RCR68060.1 hypothetical protein DUE52_18530 [Larkinella punicea]